MKIKVPTHGQKLSELSGHADVYTVYLTPYILLIVHMHVLSLIVACHRPHEYSYILSFIL